MDGNRTVQLNLPEQDLADFTLFPPNAAAAIGWAQALPVANTDASVELLLRALDELNHYRLHPEIRFSILEALRPNLDVALPNLARRYLNQPLVLPDEPQRAANASKTLYHLMSTAYSIAAVDAIQDSDSIRNSNPGQLACESIQRALVYAGGMVLQSFQLFRPLEVQGWHTLHKLYALAEQELLTDLPLDEPVTGARSIRASYLQSILLSCCKPNHLRQSDLSELFAALQDWAERVQFSIDADGLFIVDLDSDQPAQYISLYPDREGDSLRRLDTRELVAKLASPAGAADTGFSATLPDALRKHLVSSLGQPSLRNFKRTESDAILSVCIGLSSTHYHVANQRSFESLLYGEEAPSAGEHYLDPAAQDDVWRQARPGSFTDSGTDDGGHYRYPEYRVQLADASPGGYCLHWTGELPADLKAGDILGLKEEEHRDWGIAVIRWLNQVEPHRTLIGLELLSPRAMPYGASARHNNGERPPPVRVLLLPEITLVNQPTTLITPRWGFQENQKLTLSNHAEECSVQLLRQVSSSSSFVQFEFRYIHELGDVLAENQGLKLSTQFDSLWSHI